MKTSMASNAVEKGAGMAVSTILTARDDRLSVAATGARIKALAKAGLEASCTWKVPGPGLHVEGSAGIRVRQVNRARSVLLEYRARS